MKSLTCSRASGGSSCKGLQDVSSRCHVCLHKDLTNSPRLSTEAHGAEECFHITRTKPSVVWKILHQPNQPVQKTLEAGAGQT